MSKNLDDEDLTFFMTFLEIKLAYKKIGRKISVLDASQIFIASKYGEEINGFVLAMPPKE